MMQRSMQWVCAARVRAASRRLLRHWRDELDQSLLTSAPTGLKLCFCWLVWSDKSVGVLEPKALEGRIRQLLGQPVSDEKLRAELEELATNESSFSGFTWLWGPALYKRNRILFMPFILSKFSTYMTLPKWRVEQIAWKGAKLATLGAGRRGGGSKSRPPA